MLRLCKSGIIPSGPETQIRNAFVRLLASEAVRLGGASTLMLVDEAGASVRERYAPMQRLLTHADERFLRREGCLEAAMRLRREHRRCYRRNGVSQFPVSRSEIARGSDVTVSRNS
jgi:hypothetical protein